MIVHFFPPGGTDDSENVNVNGHKEDSVSKNVSCKVVELIKSTASKRLIEKHVPSEIRGTVRNSLLPVPPIDPPGSSIY